MTTLDEIRARLAKATPGPWVAAAWAYVLDARKKIVAHCVDPRDEDPDTTQGHANAEMIAHAPTDLAFLLERAERAERERDAALKDVDECQQIAGKVLGYPWYKDDQKNFPNANDANGVCIGEHCGSSIVQELANALIKRRELCIRAELERDAALDKVRAWIDMIENCAGVPQNPDSLPQMLLHEMRKLTPSERESTP
jgi:hypothetical protein